jgi:hypothetical protein
MENISTRQMASGKWQMANGKWQMEVSKLERKRKTLSKSGESQMWSRLLLSAARIDTFPEKRPATAKGKSKLCGLT